MTTEPIITKQYIQEKLLNKSGGLNRYKTKLITETPEELFLIFNNLKETPRCKCGGKPSFISFKKGFREYCSNKCSSNCKLVQEKYKATNLKNCGCENPSQSEEIKEKKKTTSLKNYGVGHPMQSKEVQGKFKSTCFENLGVEYPSQSEEIKEKKKTTNLKNCGFEHPSQSKEFKEKSKTTSLKNYGVEHPMQSGLYSNSGYKYKDYIYPSGKVIKVQGYEPKLLDELILIYSENEILTDRKDMPEFWYFSNGKKHRYFPDAYIPKDNLIYEVKSEYTLNKSKKNGIYNLKTQSVIDAGFKFKLRVY